MGDIFGFIELCFIFYVTLVILCVIVSESTLNE